MCEDSLEDGEEVELIEEPVCWEIIGNSSNEFEDSFVEFGRVGEHFLGWDEKENLFENRVFREYRELRIHIILSLLEMRSIFVFLILIASLLRLYLLLLLLFLLLPLFLLWATFFVVFVVITFIILLVVFLQEVLQSISFFCLDSLLLLSFQFLLLLY